MKKLNILLLILSFALVSCEFDEGFEELNVNPTSSADLGVNPKFAYLFLKTAGEEYEVSYTEILCAGQIVQQVIDQTFPQGSIYSMREDLNYAWWDVQYTTTIKTVVDIIDQLEKAGNTGTEMGIARIWKVYIFHKIVDTYGETPYFGAGKGYIDSNFRPVYDSVELIYMDMLKELEEGVAQIGASSSLGNADSVFDGDTAKWEKFGNSLMLRLAMRIKNVDPAKSTAWVAKAISGGVMSSGDDTAKMIQSAGPTDLNKNAWGTYVPRYPRAKIGKTLYDWLSAKSDPRLTILADPSGPNAGNPYGFKDAELGATGIDVSALPYAAVNPAITAIDSPRMFMTYSQTALVLAEHYAVNGDHVTAKGHYDKAVRSAMNQWALFDASLAIPPADIDNYLTTNSYNSTDALKMIGDQFWVASFFDFFEAFSNYRRTGYPDLVPFGGEPAHPENLTDGKIPRRLIVNPNEANVNTENFNAMEASQGANNQKTRVWWDIN